MASRQDEYGNAISRSNQSRGGRTATRSNLPKISGRSRGGGVPYAAFKTGRRRAGAVVGDTQTQPFPDPPDTWMGTLPEWAIYWAHLALGRKPFGDFQYQYSFDGSTRFDFYEFQEHIAIEVEGLYWHYEFQHNQAINDQLRKIRVESVGITLIFIDEDMALADPIFYLREALSERDHSRATKGGSL